LVTQVGVVPTVKQFSKIDNWLSGFVTLTSYGPALAVSVGVRNLLNTVYRDYLNGMRYFTDEMGRNISIRLKIQL
jgi:iron complex outermembrane receptor protein